MATKRLSDGSSLANSFKLSRGATLLLNQMLLLLVRQLSTGAATATVAYTAAT
jgi:hypothetical protein